MFGHIREGARGLHPTNDDVADANEYGIDWEAMRENRDGFADELVREEMRRYFEGAPQVEGAPQNAPRNLAHVPCEPVDCPLEEDQVARLDEHIRAHFPQYTSNVVTRREIWASALAICQEMSDEF